VGGSIDQTGGRGVAGGERGNIPDKPDKTFGSNVFLSLELVEDKVLESLGLKRSGELTVSDFLRAG
jgi:hypothetical protein